MAPDAPRLGLMPVADMAEVQRTGYITVATAQRPGYGTLDTAGGFNLIGRETLARWREAAEVLGVALPTVPLAGVAFRYGNGSTEQCPEAVLIPVRLGEYDGLIKVAVVDGAVRAAAEALAAELGFSLPA